jgi:hypothetical protein
MDFPLRREDHLTLALQAMHVLEAMFFTGLGGCALVVVISWIEIFRDGFSEDSR